MPEKACLSFFVVIIALLNVAQGKRKAFYHCSPTSDVIKQNVRNTMSLHIMAAWSFDVCIIFWNLFLLLETGSEDNFPKIGNYVKCINLLSPCSKTPCSCTWIHRSVSLVEITVNN